MDSSSVMAVFSALALGHSIFLASHFWSPLTKSPSRFFLALLLSALAIRITKSVLVILIPESPDIIPAVGLIGLSIIGPALYFYVRSFKNVRFTIAKSSLWHFALALSLIILIPLLNDQQMFIAYCVAVAHMFLYILFSAIYVIKEWGKFKPIQQKWLVLLLSSVTVIWITFFFQLLIEAFITYLSVTIVAAAMLYGLSIWAQRKKKLFIEPKRSLVENDFEILREIGEQIQALLQKEKIYTNSDLTVKSLSNEMGYPEYLVSQAINFHFNKSFPELLNEYRVEYAVNLITSKTYDNLSVEGIAYESGYNSISAFYRAFKKIKGMTPANFKKASLKTA
jgi:AraC-like DNA-binding protein